MVTVKCSLCNSTMNFRLSGRDKNEVYQCECGYIIFVESWNRSYQGRVYQN